MYHFLGIVAEDDLQNGIIVPSYILCQAHGTSEKRSGWRVVKQTDGNSLRTMNKVMVKNLSGNEDMIDFLCGYRTRDHMHGDRNYTHEETKKYYPKGALFWFECNEYGEPGKYAVFITRVPIESKKRLTDAGFKTLKEKRNQAVPMKTILSREPACEVNVYSEIKPRLPQRR